MISIVTVPESIRLRLHHEDHYVDEITIDTAPPATYGLGPTRLLRIHVEPRYKTSGMSGNEWRITAILRLARPVGTGEFSQSFADMRAARAYSPFFTLTEGRDLAMVGPVTLNALRKGHVLSSSQQRRFDEAAVGLNWILNAHEFTSGYVLSDEIERQHCQQVGCSAPPARIYRLKKHQETLLSDRMFDFEDFQARHIWFCGRHARRGDCGIQDADKNYEAADGKGPPGKEVVSVSDERPSAVGGTVEGIEGIAEVVRSGVHRSTNYKP